MIDLDRIRAGNRLRRIERRGQEIMHTLQYGHGIAGSPKMESSASPSVAPEEHGTVFYTTLMSSNFALNAATDYGATALAKLFTGMSVETAQNIIDRGEGRLVRPARNSVWVPNDLLGGDNAPTTVSE